jgi:hypothetical protein
MKHEITYRGWTINRWPTPGGCFSASSPPSPAKATPLLGRSLVQLCDAIDKQIAEWADNDLD